MPVPSAITDLSTTIASNSPNGSDNVFPDLDNYLRALSGFVASIRDNSGNSWTSPYLPLTGGTVTGATTFSSTASATKFIPTGGSATGNGMYLPAANTLAWSNNGSETMRLDSSGNLGLGVTPSAWTGSGAKVLEIGSKGNAILGNNSVVDVTYNAYFDSAWKYGINGFASYYAQTGGSHQFFTAPTGTAGNAISFTQAMTLDASGNLGVGQTANSARLHVKSNGQSVIVEGTTARGSGNVYGSFFDPTGRKGYWGYGGGDDAFYLANEMNAPMLFFTNNTERARITSGGDLLVGTTSSSGWRTSFVAQTSGVVGCSLFSVTEAADYPVGCVNEATSGDNNFVWFLTEAAGSSARGSIDYNRAGGLVRYNTTSDYRAKDIIGPVQNVGATIDALKVYEGKMKGATQSRPMLVAHEAQAHAPYAVSGVKDEENEDGTPKFQQMDVSSLVPLLLAEIQSLRARVAALEQA